MHHLRRSTPVRGGIPVDKAGNRGLVQRDATCDHSSIRNAPGMRWARRDATPAPSRSTASCSTISHSEARPPPTGLVDQRSAVYRAALRCARALEVGFAAASARAARTEAQHRSPIGSQDVPTQPRIRKKKTVIMSGVTVPLIVLWGWVKMGDA